jgi:hypothetical protein
MLLKRISREAREGAKNREGAPPRAKRVEKHLGKHERFIDRMARRAGTISSHPFAPSRPSREILFQKLSRQNDGCYEIDNNARACVV